MNVKEIAWIYLIKNGSVSPKWSYYGSGFEVNKSKTKKALKDILSSGVDWSKTNEPYDDQRDYFNGTFAEEPAYTKTFYGNLVTNSGNKYNFECEFNEPRDVFEMFASFIEIGLDKLTIEEVIKQRIKDF